MLSAKVTSVFNPDFAFDTNSTTATKPVILSNQNTVKETVISKGLNDLMDDDDSNDESKKELEKLINNKDKVRLKTQPTKVT